MGKFDIETRGFNALERFFLGLIPKTSFKVKALTESTIRLMEADAKQRAPVNYGKLRQAIHAELTDRGFGGKLACDVAYFAYVEFGTGGLVKIPDGFEDLAAQFKGQGKRKVNIPAQPFLIPAYLKYKDHYIKGIKEILSRLFW